MRSHATFITEEMLAHYVMIVKHNQKTLYARLDDLDWAGVPITHQTSKKGHGRREKRTIRVMDAPADLGFPHVAQVFLLERYTTRTVRKRTKGSRKYQIHDGEGSQRCRSPRDHQPVLPRGRTGAPGRVCPWALGDRKNKIHWVRDVTFREDESQVRTASRFRTMATLRNLAIGLIRQASYTKIAATIRKIRNNPHLLLAILGPRQHPHNTP